MFFTASPYQRTTRCQRMGYSNPAVQYTTAPLEVADLFESLTKAAYEEERQRRDRAVAELKRKRLEEEQRARQVLVRHNESEESYQIEIWKPQPLNSNFKSYQIQYFKRGYQLLLRISSRELNKDFWFDSREMDETKIDFKIFDKRLLVIDIPKRYCQEIDSERIFNLVKQQQSKIQEAEIRKQQQWRENQQRHLVELARQRQLQLLKEEQLQREALEREELERNERLRQEQLHDFLNQFISRESLGKLDQYLTINGLQIPIQLNDTESQAEAETDSETESYSDYEAEATPSEASEEFSDIEDPPISDISQDFDSSTVIKKVSNSDSDSIETKKGKLRSPSLEEVQDEEFINI